MKSYSPFILCWRDGSDAKNLKEVFQLQFGAGEGAGLEENLAAAQQQMQVMQQVIMMEMVMLLVLLAMVGPGTLIRATQNMSIIWMKKQLNQTKSPAAQDNRDVLGHVRGHPQQQPLK